MDKKAKAFTIDSELLDKALLIGTISAIFGARFSYIISYPSAFKGDISSIFSLNTALLDPAGGFVIGFISVFLLVSRQKIEFWNFLDSLTPFLGVFIPAYFLSRFASGSGFGLATNLPWGIYLWGTTRHPVQLYLTFLSLIPLAIILLYAPAKKLPSGSTFLIFTIFTSSYILFIAAFQVPNSLIAGFRFEQIASWIIILISLILLNSRMRTPALKDHYETQG